MEEDATYNILELGKCFMYYQGYWQDDAEPDLDFYLKYFTPWLAHMISKHRSLHLALQIFRSINPRFIIVTNVTLVFFFYPMGLYAFRNNSTDVLANFYGLILHGIQLAGVTTAYLQPEAMHNLINDISVMLKPKDMDNKEQKSQFYNIRLVCYNSVKRVQIPVTILYSVLLIYEHCFNLLPERRNIIREWYPWNTTSSPGFEITLFTKMFQVILTWTSASTLAAALTVGMILPWKNFKILSNKLENIQAIAIKRCNARRLKGSDILPELTLSIVPCEDIGQFDASGSTVQNAQLGTEINYFNARNINNDRTLLNSVQEVDYNNLPGVVIDNQLTAGFVASNSRRVDNLALLRPLVGIVPVTERGQNTCLQISDNIEEINDNSTQDCQMMDDGRTIGITPQELDSEMKAVLNESIDLHVKLIRYVNLFSNTFNILLIVMFVANTLCLGVVALLLKDNDDPRNTENAVFSMVIAVIYLTVNNMMLLMSEQHAAVCESIYNSDWLEASPSFKKSMLVIMSRANQPLEIKPTGLDPLSRKNFANVMNSAYKMVNTLKTVIK